MHATIIQALGAERIRELHEQAATDRLLAEARRARRAAAPELARPRMGRCGCPSQRHRARRGGGRAAGAGPPARGQPGRIT